MFERRERERERQKEKKCIGYFIQKGGNGVEK
jgi:hypothetical protein